MSKSTINIAVRELVEFVFRSGSINSQYRSAKRASDGTKIHNILQKKHKKIAKHNGLTYDSEVAVGVKGEYKEFDFNIDGRIDGVVEEFNKDGTKKRLHIEEIKSSSNIDNILEDFAHWHFAQAKCYGYMYALAENFSEITVNLTYCQIDSLEEKTFEKEFSFNELKEFFYDVLEAYYKWHKLLYDNAIKRNATIKKLKFPFDSFRKGQRDFSVAVYKTLYSRKKIFAQAPTGTGKTVSTIFPAIKFMGEEDLLFGKIFYATAKTITKQNAEFIINKMRENGLFIKAINLTAKDKICLCDEKSCTPEKCIYADGHFDRVNDALFDIITNEEMISKDTIVDYAIKYNVCPFELSLDVTSFCDLIICDYNYIFDPSAQLKRFFGEEVKGDFIVLVDEAHNLSDRAREMYSSEISRNEISDLIKVFRQKKSPLYKSILKLYNFLFLSERKVGDEKAILNKNYPDYLVNLLQNIQAQCDKWLVKNEKSKYYENVLDLFFKVIDFLRIIDFFSKDYIVLSFYDDDDFKIKLLCVNPSNILKNQEKKFLSSVFFSATLTPIDYFIDILGGDKSDNKISINSPFKKENLKVTVDTSISTKYKHRYNNIPMLCEKIYSATVKMIGNHFVFFPSYEYMEKVFDFFKDKYSGLNVCIQPRNMTEEDKEQFLDKFTDNPKDTFIAFAVMGGVFSEGIDLTGDRLCGAIIVGVGLPLITLERDIIKEYYNRINGKGFDYAYTYSGFIKVMQSAGRVIRTEDDKGYVLLIDSRFGEWKYKELMPSWWGIWYVF